MRSRPARPIWFALWERWPRPLGRWRAPAGSGRFVGSTLSVMLSLDCTIAHYQRLDLPVVGFCFRFSDYHKPSAVALAVAEGGRMGRPAHNSFALARCDAGTPSSV
jgi:hypothetical protein